MTEPTTPAGKALLADMDFATGVVTVDVSGEYLRDAILAIEREARAPYVAALTQARSTIEAMSGYHDTEDKK